MKLTKYERARLIGARALQISMGAPLLLDLKEAELEKVNYSPIEIAKLEFDKGILPITIKRPMPKNMAK
jgi:DNA-directed RNA polymerase subunit K/omega